MPTETVDVVVVGSGYGGSIPAARFAEHGASVVVLERGVRMMPSDFRQSDAPGYIQSMTDVVVASNFVAYRTGKLVGGASIPMDGAHFRIPQHSFEVVDSTGQRHWPDVYSPTELAPYWTMAEAMLNLRRLQWTDIPKSGGLFAKMLDAYGATADRAILNYDAGCVQCGFCAQGCIYDYKHTLTRTYIPLAEAHGAQFRTGCQVTTIEPMGTSWLVHYVENGVAKDIVGQKLFIAGGGLHTPALLLRSRNNLPNLSDQVGQHFNHNGELQFFAVLPPEFDDLESYNCFKGMDNAGMMTFHFYESDGFTLHPGGGIEPTVFAARIESSTDPVLPTRSWGMDFKRFVERVYPHRVIGFSSLGLADSHGKVVLAGNGSDPDVVETDRTAYDAYLDRLVGRVTEVAQHSGISVLPAYPKRYAGMTSAHLLGSCRISASPDRGVVDPDCKVWGYENLYICDASAVPYALGVNPSLNISAIAERAAQRAIMAG